MSLLIKSNASLLGTIILSKLFFRFKKTFKDLVFSQKILDCTGSKIDISFLSTASSLVSCLILSSIESLDPSILIAVIDPLVVRSLNVKWSWKNSG